MKHRIATLGNLIYRYTPYFYRPLYATYKALSDRVERDLMRTLVRPGMTAIDVGANIGTSTDFLLKLVGAEGAIYSFEPEPRNFALLEKALSGTVNVHLVNAAVGPESGALGLYISEELNSDHQTYDSGESRSKIEVDVIALDDFFDPGAVVDFVKVDVQGFDLHVLKGAERLLSENADIGLLLEFWPYGLRHAGVDPGEMIDFLRERAFVTKVIGRKRGMSVEDVGEGFDDYVNLYARRENG